MKARAYRRGGMHGAFCSQAPTRLEMSSSHLRQVAHIRETKMVSMASSRISTGLIAAVLLFGLAVPLHAREFIKGERPQQRGYSQAVITEGGKTIWLGGQLAVVDDSGKSLAGDVEGQVRQIFKLINATLCIEPDWIIGTSIGAINASLIAGNEPENRLERM